MATESDDTREHGIEFGDLPDDLEEESYPLSHEALLDRYGDRELGVADDRVALREVLLSESDQEYEDPESVRQAILNMVGEEAVGREGYSDRGGNSEEAGDSNGEQSF